MRLHDSPQTRDLNDVWREIERLDLVPRVAELEAFGYTVIENAIAREHVERAREVILDLAQERFGRRPDLDRDPGLAGWKGDFDPQRDPAWRARGEWELFAYLLFRDPVFEEFLLNPKPLALITYLLGKSCLLSSMTCHFKGQGDHSALGLHSDTANGAIAPFPAHSVVANCNYALTDYTEAGGCLGVVPGSHRLARQPLGREASLSGPDTNPAALPIEVPAGSAIVWHGNTWHGSYPRRLPGIRMNLAVYFCRQPLATQERFKDNVPNDVLARRGNDARFLALLGGLTSYGWTEAGPSADLAKSRAGQTFHA